LKVMQRSSASDRPTPVWVRHENASLGRSLVGAERSRRNITARESIAATISPNLERGDATTDAKDVPAIARQSRATRPAGTREVRGRWVADCTDGRTKKALVERAPAVTAVATKAVRQLPNWANIPPTSGPISTDTLQLPDINAITRDQTDWGKVSRTSTYATATTKPPPNP